MQEIINVLSDVDDDYLIGLSNKGTLKRAYKDLESSEISVEYGENSAVVTVSGEKCTVVSPIGESKCSCPSRSICRHIVTAVLWLKKNVESGVSESENQNNNDEKKKLEQDFIDELSAYPLKAVQKSMKKQYYNAFIAKAETGILPEIEETSIINVRFSDENISVRLIKPLEYSTCTCHSKDLCRHKAAAILAWQLKHNKVKLEDIKINEEISSKIDVLRVCETAEFSKAFLSKLLSDGLVRASENLIDETESVAVMCHNSGIAECEKLMREIGNRLKGYIDHSPEFNADILFSLVMENIMLLDKIITTTDEKALRGCLGEFKGTYLSADTLEIIPIAQRHFSSAAGYEGEIFYFLNKNRESENRFLTYSAIRPTFYEKTRGKTALSAPWGLYGRIDELMKSEIRLKNPRLSGIKISSSNDTQAEIIESVNLNQQAVYDMIYTDFHKMLYDYFLGDAAVQSNGERLVFAAPKKCISSSSDEITQSHSIVIEDKNGGRLTVTVRYRSDNRYFFSQLAQIGNMMLEHPEKQFVIFGNIYIENGQCFLYPIAIFDNIIVSDRNISEAKTKSELDVGHYRIFSNHFYDIKKLLCDIIQCGINSFDMHEQIKDYASESGKMGLLMLSQKLDNLNVLIKAKKHTYSDDNSEIIAVLAEIFYYVSIGIKHTEYNLAVENLRSEVK